MGDKMKFDWLKQFTKRIFRRFRYGKSSMWFYQIDQSSNNAEMYLEHIKNAGSVFLGYWSPEAMGDYITGSNHVLPTNGTAKFSSALSVLDFMKRVSVTKVNKNGLKKLGPAVVTLAESEGLQAHALSVSERLKNL